jgi:hypothetical protein
MRTCATPAPDTPDWEPFSDIPLNLERDGRNYIEWVWSLLDDGIEVSNEGSFSALKTDHGQPLLADFAAEYLDEQMLIAKRAAIEKGHGFADVIMCCKAPNVDYDAITSDLLRLFFQEPAAAVARAKSIGEICDVAEDFCKAAIHLKFDLSNENLPKAVRKALNGPVEGP